MLLSFPVLSQWNYYLNDHLGNTRVVLDEAGDVKEFYDYYPFGLSLRENIVGVEKARYKFTGKELDEEQDLGWYYFGARYYDASIGRWLGVDPMWGQYPSLSPYNYTFNNPFNFIDPDGEWPTRIHNRILREAFAGILTVRQIAVLQAASKFVDRDQSAGGSFKHAMRSSESIGDAKQKMGEFIETKKKEFVMKNGDEALFSLGEALHPVMDSTSPAHVGFQVWEGLDNPSEWWNGIKHFLKEMKISEEKIQATVNQIKKIYEEFVNAKEEQRKKEEKEKFREGMDNEI